MQQFQVMASVYDDLTTEQALTRIYFYTPAYCTPIFTISCESIDDLPDVFLDKHGEDCDRLHGYVYLYAKSDGSWQRITH